MITGFAFSPVGLLLPYHLGALAALSYHGYVTDSTPIAGSSAGAIAVAAHAAGVPSRTALEASIHVSSQCNPLFLARGGLLKSLGHEMDKLFPTYAHEVVNDRPGLTGLAHREIFPDNHPVLATSFETRDCLMDAVMDSSMFPYFTSNRPARAVWRHNESAPRIVVDGFFAYPMQRIGVPDFDSSSTKKAADGDQSARVKSSSSVDRTIIVSCFPRQMLSLTTTPKENMIGPDLEENNLVGQALKLVYMATQSTPRGELTALYDSGWSDTEKWITKERRRERLVSQTQS